jgi:hypothetical protein
MQINFSQIIAENKFPSLLIGEIYPIKDRYADLPTSTDSIFEQIKTYYKKTDDFRSLRVSVFHGTLRARDLANKSIK